jgi:heat-inducible transcriptional repressor
MHDLTARQVDILKSLIEEYIQTAEPVGSETLEKKHNLSASPATIRNEMVRLTELGYLKKPHVSAGRVPTPEGMKFYVKQLMKEKDLSVAEEVSLKEKVWDLRERERDFLKELTKALADRTKALAVTTTNEGDVFCAGYANILDMPEFFEIEMTKNLLTAVDEGYATSIMASATVHSFYREKLRNLVGWDTMTRPFIMLRCGRSITLPLPSPRLAAHKVATMVSV